jgi:hypothetical protein
MRNIAPKYRLLASISKLLIPILGVMPFYLLANVMWLSPGREY